jgi:hypothetical protein
VGEFVRDLMVSSGTGSSTRMPEPAPKNYAQVGPAGPTRQPNGHLLSWFIMGVEGGRDVRSVWLPDCPIARHTHLRYASSGVTAGRDR